MRTFVRLLALLPSTRMNDLARQTPPMRRANPPSPTGARALHSLGCAGLGSTAEARRKIPGPLHNGSWNFGAASLYNAAMLPASSTAAAFAARTAGAIITKMMACPRSILLGALFVGLSVGLAPSAALAADSSAPVAAAPPAGTAAAAKKAAPTMSGKSGKPGKPGKPGTKTSAGNKSISLDDDFLVEGKLEKPSAFYVLRRSATDYDWARLDAVFTPLVLESVQDPLF